MAENIFFVSKDDTADDRRLQRMAAARKLQKLHTGIYTDNLIDPPSEVALKNAFRIAMHLFGTAMLSGRSALAARPLVEEGADGRIGWLFLLDPTAKRRRDVSMPGLELRSVPGAGPQEGDYPMLGLVMPSRPRMLLENLSPSRSRGGPSRTAGSVEVERKLEHVCAQEGEGALNEIRDQARRLAQVLELTDEFTRLDGIIGTLLGSRSAKLSSPTASAMARGEPYDADCIDRLLALRKHLEDVALPDRSDPSVRPQAKVAASFIEAYFSNYIEGTRFPVKQADRIIFQNERPAGRPKDSHDIVTTYAQLVNLGPRLPSSVTSQEFLEEIQARHAELMAARPENNPGRWKDEANVAGNTTFVLPVYVPGTLKAGLEVLSGVTHPFAKAALIHFLLADVHPFADGNGRIARIMMTKELVGAGLPRIVIPTVYRDNYLGGLRALTRAGQPGALVRALDFCQRITAACSATAVVDAIDLWAKTYGFLEPGPNARLEMPDPARHVVWRSEVPAPEDYWAAEDGAKPLLSI